MFKIYFLDEIFNKSKKELKLFRNKHINSKFFLEDKNIIISTENT